MGLERIAALLQGTHDNYETDHFKKIIQSTSEIVKQKPDQKNLSSFRVIADHLRASSFLIAEEFFHQMKAEAMCLEEL
jgi:alanyl-tRNA synthetase